MFVLRSVLRKAAEHVVEQHLLQQQQQPTLKKKIGGDLNSDDNDSSDAQLLSIDVKQTISAGRSNKTLLSEKSLRRWKLLLSEYRSTTSTSTPSEQGGDGSSSTISLPAPSQARMTRLYLDLSDSDSVRTPSAADDELLSSLLFFKVPPPSITTSTTSSFSSHEGGSLIPVILLGDVLQLCGALSALPAPFECRVANSSVGGSGGVDSTSAAANSDTKVVRVGGPSSTSQSVMRDLLPLCEAAEPSQTWDGVGSLRPDGSVDRGNESEHARRTRKLKKELGNQRYLKMVKSVDSEHLHRSQGLSDVGKEMTNMNHMMSMAFNLVFTCGSVFAAIYFLLSQAGYPANSPVPMLGATISAIIMLLVETVLYMIRNQVMEEKVPVDPAADMRARGHKLSVLNVEPSGGGRLLRYKNKDKSKTKKKVQFEALETKKDR